MIELRPYQQEALDAIEAAERRGITRPLVAMATGAGKTVVFAHLLKRRPGRGLVLAHREELLEQAAAKIKAVWPGVDLGIVQGERDQTSARVVVASIQTIARSERMLRLLAESSAMFSTVVVDEAHHASADSYLHVLWTLGAFDQLAPRPLVVGVTATPERADDRALGDVWQELVFQKDMLSLIRSGHLADVRAVQVKLAADFGTLHTRGGDFIDSEAGELLLEANAPEHAVKAYQEHAEGRKALVFVPLVTVATAMADAFNAAGIPAEMVCGDTPTEERRAILRRFSTGSTRILANAAVLLEGYDEPSVGCVIMARPTKSRGLYVQAIGRGTRLYPGKQNLLVLDLVGATSHHSLVTVASLFGRDPDELATSSVAEEPRAGEGGEAEAAARGRLVSVNVDLFAARDFAWVPAGERFVLGCGGGRSLVLVQRDADAWDVQLVHSAKHEGRWIVARRDILAEGLPLGYAQGRAEDHVRNERAEGLSSRGATWRTGEATPKQVKLLRKWKAWRPGMSKGDAADVITAHFAKRMA